MAQIDMVHHRNMIQRSRTRRSRRELVLLRLPPLLALAVVALVVSGLLLFGRGARGAAPQLSAVYHPADRSASIGAGTVPSKLLIEPNDGDRPLVRVIDHAQSTIFVEMYILSDRQVIHALERAAAQEVAVDVLLEPHPIGIGPQPQHAADTLRAAGVAVRWSGPAFALTHAKFLVADDRVAVIASANFSHSGLHSNRDLLSVDRRPLDVHAASAIFRADWDGSTPQVADSNLILSPDNARRRLTALIRRAHRSIDIYAEELRDPTMERVLAAVARRSVTVRVVLAAGQTPLDARRLARSGVPVRLLGSPYVHAKMILVDGREAFIGSENVSTQSLDRNREVGLLVRGPALQRLKRTFDADWLRATPVQH